MLKKPLLKEKERKRITHLRFELPGKKKQQNSWKVSPQTHQRDKVEEIRLLYATEKKDFAVFYGVMEYMLNWAQKVLMAVPEGASQVYGLAKKHESIYPSFLLKDYPQKFQSTG